MKRFIFIVSSLAIILVFILPFVVLSADPWNKGDMRALNAQLNNWYVPKVVNLDSGASCFSVDVTQGGLIKLNTFDSNMTSSGASIVFTGTASIPTRTWVVWHGNGYKMQIDTSHGSPINYNYNLGGAAAKTWPFQATTKAYAVYAMEILSGLGDTGGTTSTGATLYFLSGVSM